MSKRGYNAYLNLNDRPAMSTNQESMGRPEEKKAKMNMQENQVLIFDNHGRIVGFKVLKVNFIVVIGFISNCDGVIDWDSPISPI